MTMRIILVTLTLIATTILGGCNSEPIVEPADLIFAGGAVFTSDPEQPNASAIAVRGERIVLLAMKPALSLLSAPVPEKSILEMDSSYRDLWIHTPTSLMGPSLMLG